MKRARDEFAEVTGHEGDVDKALKDFSLDNCYDLTYMGYVMMEALRLNPPAPTTSMYEFERDTKLGGRLNVKAGENILVNMIALHRNKHQWQRVGEFLPDRFDQAHPLSRTPKGEKRSAYSF